MSVVMSGLFRITRDVELRHTTEGTPIITLGMAYSYGSKRDDRGYLPTQFIDGAIWGERARALREHLVKGQRLFLTLTDVHTESYPSRGDGAPKTKLVGRIDQLAFVDRVQSDGEQGRAPAPASAPRQAARPAPAASGAGFDDMDSEIPF